MRGRKTYIQSSSSDVGADENTARRIAEFEKGIGSLLLFLLAVKVEHRAVDIVEQLGIVLDGSTAAEEDNDLFLLLVHLAQKGKQQNKASISIAQNIALLQAIDGTKLLLLVDIDI